MGRLQLDEPRPAGRLHLLVHERVHPRRWPVADAYRAHPGGSGNRNPAADTGRDGGRVFVAAERSDLWHAAAGGGLWLAFLNRANTVSLAAAQGDDGVRLYARAGFAF